MLSLSGKGLRGDLITAHKYLHREKISGTKELFSLAEKDTARINVWKPKLYKLDAILLNGESD